MEGNYDVFLGEQSIGKVQVTRQGLYYCFRCRCQLTGEVIYKLLVTCEDHQENLGVFVPVDGGFGLETKLPVKRLGDGTPVFQAVPKHTELRGKFVPIYPEEPFAYISRLKDAFLAKRDGQIGVVIP